MREQSKQMGGGMRAGQPWGWGGAVLGVPVSPGTTAPAAHRCCGAQPVGALAWRSTWVCFSSALATVATENRGSTPDNLISALASVIVSMCLMFQSKCCDCT